MSALVALLKEAGERLEAGQGTAMENMTSNTRVLHLMALLGKVG